MNTNSECISETFSQDIPCEFTGRKEYSSGINTFKQVDFHDCVSTTQGGAIACSGTDTQLFVESCSFSSCSAFEKGGSIHTNSLHTLEVKQSIFYKCSTETTVDNQGSGAIWISGIQTKLSLFQTDFISCITNASGGAFSVWSCSNQIQGPQIINSCRFLDCNAITQTPDGGAMAVWTNSGFIGFMNCLISRCNADYGGALSHYVSNYQSESHPFRYSFFNHNTGSQGNDIFFLSSPSSIPLLSCFSTSTSPRICNGNYDNWLALTSRDLDFD